MSTKVVPPSFDSTTAPEMVVVPEIETYGNSSTWFAWMETNANSNMFGFKLLVGIGNHDLQTLRPHST